MYIAHLHILPLLHQQRPNQKTDATTREHYIRSLEDIIRDIRLKESVVVLVDLSNLVMRVGEVQKDHVPDDHPQ